jgi:hypothetical protein
MPAMNIGHCGLFFAEIRFSVIRLTLSRFSQHVLLKAIQGLVNDFKRAADLR